MSVNSSLFMGSLDFVHFYKSFFHSTGLVPHSRVIKVHSFTRSNLRVNILWYAPNRQRFIDGKGCGGFTSKKQESELSDSFRDEKLECRMLKGQVFTELHFLSRVIYRV